MKEVLTSILFLILAGGLLWGWLHVRENRQEAVDTRPSISASPLQITVPETPKPVADALEASGAPVPSQTETKPSAPITPAASLDVKVMNGGGIKGSAGKVQTFLKGQGYTKTQVGNTVGDYTGVTVYFRDGKEADADAVKQLLLKDYPSAQTKVASSVKNEDGSADVVVILGKMN